MAIKKNPCISRSIFLHYALMVNSPLWEKHYLKINFTVGTEKSMKNNHSIQGITAEWGAWFKEVPNSKDYTVYQKKTPPFCMFKKFILKVYGLEYTVMANTLTKPHPCKRLSYQCCKKKPQNNGIINTCLAPFSTTNFLTKSWVW